MPFITAADLSMLVTYAQLSQISGVPGMTLENLVPRLETDRAREIARFVLGPHGQPPANLSADVRRIHRLAGLAA